MQYKIVVDKQSRANPSTEKREYIIDIEELRYKGDLYDSIVITIEEDYVLRRFELVDGKVLKLLDEPKKEPLKDINIELFEGDNYIYLADKEGNRLYAEYLLKNDFTERYVMQSQLQSAIEQLAGQITLSINEKLEGYYNSSEIDTMLQLQSGDILAQVSGTFQTKSDADDTETELRGDINQTKKELNASLELKLNKDDLFSEINASADRISLNAGRLLITSGNFQLDEKGNITAVGGTIGGFTLSQERFSGNLDGYYAYDYFDARIAICLIMDYITSNTLLKKIYDYTEDNQITSGDYVQIYQVASGSRTSTKRMTGSVQINSKDPKNCLIVKSNGEIVVSIGVGGVGAKMISSDKIVCGKSGSDTSSFKGVVIDGDVPKINFIQGASVGTEITYNFVKSSQFLDSYDREIGYPDCLYSNSSGTSGSISLSKSISNYTFIEIYFCDDWGNMDCVKLTVYNGSASGALNISRIADGTLNLRSSLINVSGSTLMHDSNYRGTYTSWNNAIDTAASIKIKYVYAYK